MRVRQRNFQPKDIAKDIMNGNSFDRVQKKYGIKMRSQLLDLYTRGLAQLEQMPNLERAGQRRQAGKQVDSNARRVIGSSGTITLTRSLLLDQLGFREGDQFTVCRKGDAIILQKVE